MSADFQVFAVIGFVAQPVDGALGMAFLGGALAAPVGAPIVKRLPVRPLMLAVTLVIITTSTLHVFRCRRPISLIGRRILEPQAS